MRILVTAVGGDIGYGIGKILRLTGIAEFSIGCDIHRDHAGELFFSKCEVVPRASSDDYLDALIHVARMNRVDMIIPASEPEIRLLLRKGIQDNLDGIPLVLANTKSLDIGFDKLRTAEFLRECGLHYPWTNLVSDGPPQETPCIVKDRFGAGGRNIALVTSENRALHMAAHGNGIWQELLEPEEEEYTCGLYRSASRVVRHIVIKRKLVGGSTKFGRVCHDKPQIGVLLSEVAEHLDLQGSINVQLRLTRKGPTIFEINPRFSSTLVFRHLLGFQDVVWSIKERIGASLPEYSAPPDGIAFYRGSEELIIPNQERRP